jgi:hypothetical protein
MVQGPSERLSRPAQLETAEWRGAFMFSYRIELATEENTLLELEPTKESCQLDHENNSQHDSIFRRLPRISVSTSVAPESSSQSMKKPSRCRRAESSMALAASLRISSSTLAHKPFRNTASSVASLVSSRQFRPIFSIYVNDLNSQSDKGAHCMVGVVESLQRESRLVGRLPLAEGKS